jgi:type IV secretory pathway VirB10-like protein
MNNRATYLAIGIFAAIVGMVSWVAITHSFSTWKPAQETHGEVAAREAKAVAGGQTQGIVAAAGPKKGAGHPAPPSAAGLSPSPESAAAAPSPTPDEALKRRRQAFLEALTSKPTFDDPGFERLAQTAPSPTPFTPQQVAMMQRSDPNNLNAQSIQDYQRQVMRVTPASPANGALARFQGDASRWDSTTVVEHPSSPYVIQPGTVIPATLYTAINSDLPGQITAQVSQDVLDSPGRGYLLIPQGSFLVGEYQNKTVTGQNRVYVVWQLLRFPNGDELDLGAMAGADADGTSGLHDQVDTHFWEVLPKALLLSAITAGVAVSQPSGGYGYGQADFSSAISASVGQSLGAAITQLLGQHLAVSPTIRIRPGFVMDVIVSKNLYFNGPYQRPDYDAQ